MRQASLAILIFGMLTTIDWVRADFRRIETESEKYVDEVKAQLAPVLPDIETGWGSERIVPLRDELGVELSTIGDLESLLGIQFGSAEMQFDLRRPNRDVVRLIAGPSAVIGIRSHRRNRGYQTELESTILENREDSIGFLFPRRRQQGHRLALASKTTRVLAQIGAAEGLVGWNGRAQGSALVHEQNISGQIKIRPDFYFSPFVQRRNRDFSHRTDLMLSHRSLGQRAGLSLLWAPQPYTLALNVHEDRLKRDWIDERVRAFTRQQVSLSATYQYRLSPRALLDTQVHLHASLDTTDDFAASSRALPEAATTLRLKGTQSFGLDFEGIRFEKPVSTVHLFGDGGGLAGNSALQPASGERLSVRAWIGEDATLPWMFSIRSFVEYSRLAAIPVSASPTSTRMESVGATWARGLEFAWDWKHIVWSGKTSLQLQEAINGSEVQWQRGLPLPGRPQRVFRTKFERETGGNVQGIEYAYLYAMPLDLSGYWSLPQQHRLDLFWAWRRDGWQAKIVGRNLLQAQLVAITAEVPPALLQQFDSFLGDREIAFIYEFQL